MCISVCEVYTYMYLYPYTNLLHSQTAPLSSCFILCVCVYTRNDGDSENQAVGLPSSQRVQGLLVPLRSVGEGGRERAEREREMCGHTHAVRRHQQGLADGQDKGS